jgi:hypothetical protein
LAGVTIAVCAMILPIKDLFAPFVLVGLAAIAYAALQNRALHIIVD